MTEYTPLFPYPFCCICYEPLHPGHHGWDVCSECVSMGELVDDIACACYAAMSEMWY